MEERRSRVEVHQGLLVGLPEGVKQYPMENGWLLLSPIGMCFIPNPETKTVAPSKEVKGKFR